MISGIIGENYNGPCETKLFDFKGDLPFDRDFKYEFVRKKKDNKGLCYYICSNAEKKEHYVANSCFVGVDWIIKNRNAIYVRPKLNNEVDQTDYLEMLFSALKNPGISGYVEDLFEIKFEDPQIEITQQQDILTPLLVVQFLGIVKEIVRKGLKKSYYRVEQNLNAKVKGKILVGQTLKQNHFKNRPLYTYCSFQEFGLNGLENRLLKKALIFVQRYLPTIKKIHSEKYSADIFSYIMPAFEQVSEEVSLHEVKHAIKNVFYKEYEEAIKLARLILQRFGYNITNTQSQTIKTPPFWIDMSKLFELYVLGLLKEIPENKILYGAAQVSGTYGVLPDFLQINDKKQRIIDAKYKQQYQPENINFNEYLIKDIRQLAGYARDRKILKKLGIEESKWSETVPECLIIYPDQNATEEIDENRKRPIPAYENFYKLPVKLPTI